MKGLILEEENVGKSKYESKSTLNRAKKVEHHIKSFP